MKITIGIKDPDGFYESIQEQAIRNIRKKNEELYRNSFEDKQSKKAFNDMVQDEVQEIKESLKRWVQFGECCTLEFDTEAGTAIVKTVR